MKTFKELTDEELQEVRNNDPIVTPFCVHSRMQFAIMGMTDLIRHYAACKLTETEMLEGLQACLVNIANLAQHSAESIGLCPPEDLKKEISEEWKDDCYRAVQWMAEHIKTNMRRVKPTQLGGSDRFAVEFDAPTLHALFEMAEEDD